MSAATRPEPAPAKATSSPEGSEAGGAEPFSPGTSQSRAPLLPALTGLALTAAPFAVVGGTGPLTGLTGPVPSGCSVALDLLLVLCGVTLAWHRPPGRRRFWHLGVTPLLGGLSLLSGAALLTVNDPVTAAPWMPIGLTAAGRALAGIGTGTLTVYWLRANTGSLAFPAHGPSRADRIRTSRSAPLLALTGLILCGVRTDVLTAVYLLPVYLLSAWLVATLIRAPHSPLTRALDALGRLPRRRAATTPARPDPAAPPARPDTGATPARADTAGNQDRSASAGKSSVVDVRVIAPAGADVSRPDSHDQPGADGDRESGGTTTAPPDPRSTQAGPTAAAVTGVHHPKTETETDDGTETGTHTKVSRSGRTIDLDRIPAELKLLPLPRRAGRKEQPENAPDQAE
ncbi:hypothetical protein [Kineosporia sp. NBRC 101731]|uniref:hypothetical protein n=1 Tax=Kineosporia sp. NBRC 101731 TaxID=3032199 RepID=UPI0024A023AB|nr:hypothetical protein [Kineosporia sp. NBRC 101731]GLY30057.1 hypothetical protein Kisp02_34220 [Kineosporia sp. NBRC 101731]